MSSWYERAKSSITQTMMDNPNASREELKKLCSKNYPFGKRAYYPYKAWLKAMHEVFGKKNQSINQEDLFQ